MKKIVKKILARKKQILLVLLFILIVIQFIRPTRNNGITNGNNDINHFCVASPEIKKILETSCYDCHSDHTDYPWYTNIQPVGWFLQDHVNEGKDEINFSQFKKYGIRRQIRKFEEVSEMVTEEEMPLNSYLWIHGDAKLNPEQKKTLLNWSNFNYDSLVKLYPDSVRRK